jgi:hypothetical protein
MSTTRKGRPGKGNCGVCRHPRRDMIDLGLVCGEPHAVLSERFQLSHDSIRRHSQNHLPPQVRAAVMTQLAPSAVDLEALQRSESESLLASLIGQRARLAILASKAVEDGLPSVAVRCEAAVLNNLELVSRLLGQLVSRSEITTKSMLLTPDYLAVRRILVEELRPHPELAARIAERIAAIETQAAESITAKAAKPVLIEARP